MRRRDQRYVRLLPFSSFTSFDLVWMTSYFGFPFHRPCNSKYFLWYTLFLPLVIPQLSFSFRRALQLLGVWVGTQALWLAEAYKLEFLGQNVFFSLWVRSVMYFVGHAWVLAGLVESYKA